MKAVVGKDGSAFFYLAADRTPVSVMFYTDKTNIDSLYARRNLRLVYADGSPIDRYLLKNQDPLDLPMNQITGVVFQRRITLSGSHWIAWIKVRPSAFNVKDYFDDTMADMVGYYKARVFYQPKFGVVDDTPDTRTGTIHWEPNISTDSNGEAIVTFYNTSQTGKIRLVAEGITTSGTPLTATAAYEIK